jgi:hypothetical protein
MIVGLSTIGSLSEPMKHLPPSSGLVSLIFTGCVNVVRAKLSIGPADRTCAVTSVWPLVMAFLQSFATPGVLPGHNSSRGRPPGISSGEVTKLWPFAGSTTPPEKWLGLALGGLHTPNCTITGCVIGVGKPLIVNVPEVLTDAMHPVAEPPTDPLMTGL